MKAGEFENAPIDLKVCFIQGVISESMDLVTVNPDLEVENEVISSVIKLLK